ncbi:reverse transcriptase, partial [Pelobates cultripes]
MISTEVVEMLSKGAIEELPFATPGFTSNLFLVPKKGGGVRPIINLRPFNAFLRYQHFQME